MNPILQIENLTKNYGGAAPALNNLNLRVSGGRIIGLLGPNGSGKTTLIKILAGLLTPSSGVALIDGMNVGPDTKAVVSYLPERTYLQSWMKVSQCIDYFADFYRDFDRIRAEKMLTDLNVSLDAKLSTLSKGTKEKVQLVLVMARRAKLYLLDEPIAGVDPAAREFILDTVIANKDPDATVIVSTHLITDVERVLDEFIFIRYGQVLMYNSVENARNEYGKSVDELFREIFRYAPEMYGEVH